ncbi:MAG: hypothetical protein ACFHVJ_20070 [Aestuariibacter sp.]
MWQRLGRVIEPFSLEGYSHCANPFPLNLGGNSFRIFFNVRDIQTRSHIAYVDAQLINDKLTLVENSTSIVLSPGERGAFDDSGVSLGNIICHNGTYWLYYLGWNLGKTVPWRNFIGVAKSSDLLTFNKLGRTPIIERSERDPYSLSYPCAFYHQHQLMICYGSNQNWPEDMQEIIHPLHFSSSSDGISWEPKDDIQIADYKNCKILTRPSIVHWQQQRLIFFGYQSRDNYRVGCVKMAENGDIKPMPEYEFSQTGDDWDSDIMCYPAAFTFNENLYLMYSGNGYGATGAGLAKWTT